MRNYYNGFCFDPELKVRLYNPYSTLAFFFEKVFADFWIETGQPKFIADYMKNRHLTVEQFRNLSISENFARSPGDVDTTPPEGFFYQSGYLTLHDRNESSFFLDYPNNEVLQSMSALVVDSILSDNDESFNLCRSKLLDGLRESNHKKVVAAFNRLLASVPYEDYAKTAKEMVSQSDYGIEDAEKEKKSREWIYRTKILCFLHGCGVKVFAEMHGNLGRSDMVIFHGGKTWVIEFKVAYKDRGHDPVKRAEEALLQIEENNYAAPYPDAICAGMAIDDEKRMITAFKTY